MSRTNRIITIILALLLLIAVAPDWWSSPQDYSRTPVVLGFLLALSLLLYLTHLTACELLAVMITTIPAVYLIFHGLCGYTVAEAYLLVARSALALALCFLISSIIDDHISGPLASIFRLLAALAVPLLWVFIFMKQNILFSLSLAILAGLYWLYRRSLTTRG